MAIAVPAVVVSTNDVVSVENALNSLFAIQNQTTGTLPYAGRPFFPLVSFTYHLYTLIGVADHYLYTVRTQSPLYYLPSYCGLTVFHRATCRTYDLYGSHTNSLFHFRLATLIRLVS